MPVTRQAGMRYCSIGVVGSLPTDCLLQGLCGDAGVDGVQAPVPLAGRAAPIAIRSVSPPKNEARTSAQGAADQRHFRGRDS